MTFLTFFRPYSKLQELSQQKEDLENQLSEKMDRWMYLNELAEKIENQKILNIFLQTIRNKQTEKSTKKK